MNHYRGILPPEKVPVRGDNIRVLGYNAEVLYCEPQDDWHWVIEAAFVKPNGEREHLKMILPTDYRTDDGMPNNEQEYQKWMKTN